MQRITWNQDIYADVLFAGIYNYLVTKKLIESNISLVELIVTIPCLRDVIWYSSNAHNVVIIWYIPQKEDTCLFTFALCRMPKSTMLQSYSEM